ncbi:MAG TPA: isocitrate lyase/phosphoenolpyruvate mutase family protein [Kofleriaceae bacterium]|nr:isocitrate lyase/phosphoenolpyruvate mutase family protein [Kofleriaceae bacterium]
MTAIETFRELHASGCFVLPNPWDTGSARYLHHLGFAALATTSAGFAFARGLPDEVGAIPLDATLAHLREIVTATPLPVSADFQSGFARELDDLAASVTACVRTGAAGLSIEDATGDRGAPLFDRTAAIARIRTARAAIDATGVPAVLTARCEAWLIRDPDAASTAIDRLVAFADAGADCLYAPGVRDPDTIATIVRAVAPRPVNVLVSAPGPGLTVRQLADLGVRRISVGSALARVAWGAFMRAARSLAETDAFEGLAGATPVAELNELFAPR